MKVFLNFFSSSKRLPCLAEFWVHYVTSKKKNFMLSCLIQVYRVICCLVVRFIMFHCWNLIVYLMSLLKCSIKNASQTHEEFFNDIKLVFLTIGSGSTIQDNSILHDPRRNHSVVSHATSTALLFPLCSAWILFGMSFWRFWKSWNVDSVWRILTSPTRPHETFTSGQVVGKTAASVHCISTVDVRLKWHRIKF